MTTDSSTLPSFNGRPVPWITRWTGELSPERNDYGVEVAKDGEWRLAYPDGHSVRDDRGILWQREGLGRKGEPMWADVSTFRQRAAMKRGLCQVCGTTITERPYRFLIPRDGMEQYDADTWLTMQAPVCIECVPLALKLCPALKRDGYQLLRVLDYQAWGVLGQVTYRDERGFHKIQATVCFDTSEYGPDFRLSHVMAQQVVIKLDKYVVEEVVAGRVNRSRESWEELLHPEQVLNPSPGEVWNALSQNLRSKS